jgi:hypothetical protein
MVLDQGPIDADSQDGLSLFLDEQGCFRGQAFDLKPSGSRKSKFLSRMTGAQDRNFEFLPPMLASVCGINGAIRAPHGRFD